MDTTADAGSGARAGRREWLGLAVLALPTLLLSLDLSVLYLALPHLSADLGATGTEQLWITDIYGFLIAGFLVTMGTLGDRVGRKRLLMIGGVAFAIASVLAAYSGSPEMLIASRALMGIAGATLMPSTLALISNMFTDPKQQGTAIGVWMACFMGGMALGPIVGGALLEAFWWGSVFLLAVPVMLALVVFGPALLPEYKDENAGKLDLVSVVLSLATILPVIYGLKELAKLEFGVVSFGAIVVGLIFGVVFVKRQNALEHPLLDMALFKNRTFTAAISITTAGGIMSGSYLLINLYLQVVEGLSPLQAALWLLPSAATTIVSVMMAPVIARKVRPGYAIAAGLVAVAIGYVLLTFVDGPGGLAIVVAGLVVSAAGAGPMGSLGTGLVFSSVPMEKMGSASSLSETGGEFGIAMGVATMGVIGTAVYRGQMDDVTVPAGVPVEAADAARESIAGAAAAAQSVPGEAGAALLSVARDAFSTSLNVTVTVSASLAVLLAIVAATVLRHAPATGAADGGDGGDAPAEAEAKEEAAVPAG
ncbi:MFS transporter [Amycolatopsis albispora]|uniref:MFS transporter n=1 Tax=Amycolatopsis albispora TaxID=1804986 RepID=A0A344LH63_9PSEU|nr:MFS transporter [Amycolatopsis albispora]AXB47387.1 MFS transporter [Amycolatopsis albispora]